MQNIITPDQCRVARRELGLSQADVSSAVNINRQYVSEFEGGYSNRITTAQLRKLRAFFEEKITEANANGEPIALTFGAPEGETPQSPAKVETFTAKRFAYPVSDEVSTEVMAATLGTIAANDKKLVELLTATATREGGLFGSGDFTADTLETFRQSFSLLACNYLMIRALGGWPEIGLTATGLNIAGDAVLARLIEECRASFESAGLPTIPQGPDEAEEEDEA